MRNPLLAPELRELLQEGRQADLVAVLQDMHPSDAASIVSALGPDEVLGVMAMLPVGMEREIFGYLEPDVQEQFALGAGRERLKALLASLPSDDRAELLERLDERVRNQLMPLLSDAARNDLLARARFEEDQVGAFLSTDYAVLNPALTKRQAIEELRRQAPSKETIYYSYVIDRVGRLVGFVSLRDLILAPDERAVADVMKTEVVSVTADTDQERAARLIRDYDLLALPVVDEQGRLVGIVTHDDAVDIVEEEAAEDIEKMAGVTGEAEESYLDEPVLRQARRRAPVVCLLAVFWLCAATVIKTFEAQLARSAMLVALLPMVMAIGGMVGSQASTLIIRAMTVGAVGNGTFQRVLWKELRVGLALSLVLGTIAFGNALLLRAISGDEATLAATLHLAGAVATAMGSVVVFAAALGSMVPHLARLVRIDPAMVSNPAVTALTDLTGATIYLLVVTALLGAGG